MVLRGAAILGSRLCRAVLRPTVLLVLSLLLDAPPSRAEERGSRPGREQGSDLGGNWGRGPIVLGDQFPLTSLHQSFAPVSPAVLPAGTTRLRSAFAWTNTINRRRRSYLVDAEQRELSLQAAHAPVEGFEVEIDLPVIWRGAGVLDRPIFEWHQLFGLPQGPRDDLPEDRYVIEGTDQGEPFSLSEQGTGIGDLQLSGKLLLSAGDAERPAVSLLGAVELPTSSSEYGHDGVDLSAALLVSKEAAGCYLYGGAAYLFVGDRETEGIRFARSRFAGFVAGEYPVVPALSLLLALHASTKVIESVHLFPDYQIYLDVGAKWQVHRAAALEIVVRENPAPDQGTADFTFLLGTTVEL